MQCGQLLFNQVLTGSCWLFHGLKIYRDHSPESCLSLEVTVQVLCVTLSQRSFTPHVS